MRRRNSRATSSWRVGALRTCRRTVAAARAVDQRLRPGRIRAQLGGGGFQRSEGLFDGDVGCQGDVHEGLRPVAAEVGDGADVAVGDGDQSAAWIADHGPPQGEVFDAANGVADLDGVAYDELILKNDIKTGDDVAD